VNAEDVLPKDLFSEVQRHCTGYVYVPVTREFHRKRRREILQLARQGVGTGAIARRIRIRERRVRQISVTSWFATRRSTRLSAYPARTCGMVGSADCP